MKFTAQEEYGLRCMLQFARRGKLERGGDGRGEVDGGRSLTINEIAEIEGLTPQYAGKLIRLLRMGKLLRSVRGRNGGYRLARPPHEISVGEVLAVLGGRVFEPGYCSRFTGDRKLCVHTVDCAIRSLWGAVQESVDRLLLNVKLKDLTGAEKEVAVWLGGFPRGDGRPDGSALVSLSNLGHGNLAQGNPGQGTTAPIREERGRQEP